MKHSNDGGRRLARRAALMLPVAGAVSGCTGFFDDLFFSKKTPVPGKRISVMVTRRGLEVDGGNARIALPAPTPRANAPEPGVTPTHEAGHPALGDTIAQVWKTKIGEGGGYRQKITAQPVVDAGRVFTMDSDGVVSGYDVAGGGRLWRAETQEEDSRSTNVGGGLAIDGGVLFASTGRAEVLAMDPATGKIRWRKPLPTAARAAPTVADGVIYVPTLDAQLVALKADDGSKVWTYQGQDSSVSVLGLPAPAVAGGLVIAGFGSGDLVALGTATGGVAWSDSLASARGRNSLVDLSAIHGMPVVSGNEVIAIGLGGLMLALDLRSGRRLWERDVGSSETPCVAGDWIFILSADQQVAAISRGDGKVAWVTQLDTYENMDKQKDPIVWTGPVLAGDRLLLAGSNEQALAVSPYTGKILGTQKLSGKASFAPVVASFTVFVVTDDGTMIALR
jgi:outer membrane protein assembly factor BamB